jgi:hypothetical protein
MMENTAAALEQVISYMSESQSGGSLSEFMADLSRSERQAMSELFDLCKQFCTVANDAWEEYEELISYPEESD